MVRAHTFEPQGSAVMALGLSGRERSFATVGRDGDIVLRHQTSERVLATLPPHEPVSAVLITPKADELVTLEEGSLRRYALFNPHPEISWKTLFGQRLVRRLRRTGVCLAVDRRHRRHRAEVQPRPADLRHDQGNALRDAVRGAAGRFRRTLHLTIR